jgi:hypothetical protein
MLLLCAFQTFNLLSKIFVRCQHFSERDESADDDDVHLDGSLAVQDGRKHGHAVLGESIWEIPNIPFRCGRNLRPQTGDFFTGELKHEIRRKAAWITLHCFVQSFCRDLIQIRKIAIEHDFTTPNQKNLLFDAFERYD